MKKYLNLSALKTFTQLMDNWTEVIECANGWDYKDCLYLNVVSSKDPSLVLIDPKETSHSSADMDRLCEEVFAGFGWSMGEFFIYRTMLSHSKEELSILNTKLMKLMDYPNKGYAQPSNKEKIKELMFG